MMIEQLAPCGDPCEHVQITLKKKNAKIVEITQALVLKPKHRPKKMPKFKGSDRIQGKDIVPGTEEDGLKGKYFEKQDIKKIALEAIFDSTKKPYKIEKWKFCQDRCLCLPVKGKKATKEVKGGRGTFEVEVLYRVLYGRSKTYANLPKLKDLEDRNGNNMGYTEEVEVAVQKSAIHAKYYEIYRVFRALVKIEADTIERAFPGKCIEVY